MKTNEVSINVKNCRTCPFSEAIYKEEKLLEASCYAPSEIHQGKYEIDNYYEKNTAPKWCPLNTNNLYITKT